MNCTICGTTMSTANGRLYCPTCGVTDQAEASRMAISRLASRDIQMERMRQDKKWGEQNHHPMVWMSILMEEVGELAQAINEWVFNNGPLENVLKEATQAGAVCQAINECVRRNKHFETYPKDIENNRHVRLK